MGRSYILVKKISCNVMASFLSQLTAFICGLVVPRLILGAFGSEVNGLTQSIVQFLGVIHFLDMGLGQVVCSSLYGPLAEKDYAQISRILCSGRRFYRKVGVVLGIYVLVLLAWYPRLVADRFGWAFTASMILVLSVSSFSQYFFGITNELLLHADQKNYLSYGLQIFCNTAATLLCILLLKRQASIQGVKLAAAGVFLIKPAVYAIYVRKRYPLQRNIRYTGEPIRQKWSGIAQHISAVVLDGTDNIVLTLCAGLREVSVYSVYYMVIAGIQSFFSAAVTGIQSAAGAVWAKQDREGIRRFFCTAERVLHMTAVFLFSCTGILIVPFVRVYTAGLTDAPYIQPLFAAVLVLAYGIRCLRTPYNIWVLAAGHFRQTQLCHITAAAVNLVLSVLAVFRFGLMGVALGTLAAMCWQTGWLALYTTRKLIPCEKGHLRKQLLADAAAAAGIRLCTVALELQQVSYLGWLTMAVQVAFIALGCIAAACLLFYGKPKNWIQFPGQQRFDRCAVGKEDNQFRRAL